MEEIIAYLGSLYPLSEECKSRLHEVVKRKDAKKGELLLRPGQVSDRLYFIKNGLLRCYTLQGEAEQTSWFFWEQSTVVSIQSWYTQTPGTQYIQAREDSLLYYISYADLESIYTQFIEFNYIGRLLTIRYLLLWDWVLETMRMQTALERYDSVMKHLPEILQRVPLKDVATWLGMTPETLSRIRGKMN